MINVGTIMEIYTNKALVMTVNFDLVYVKIKPEMYLGQQICFKSQEIIKPESKKKFFVASGIAAIFMFAFITYFIIQNSVIHTTKNIGYAFVDIDINPSIEFLIDKKNNVKDVLSLNSDADNLTKDLDLNNLPVTHAIEEVIEASKKEGLLNSTQNNVVLISASLNPESDQFKAEDNADEKLNQLMLSLKSIYGETNNEYSIKVVKVNSDTKKQASKNGLSIGRQLMLTKAHNNGIALTLNEAKTGSLSSLMKKVGLAGHNIDNETSNSATPKTTGNPTPTAKSISAMKEPDIKPTPAKVTSDVKSPSKESPSVSPSPKNGPTAVKSNSEKVISVIKQVSEKSTATTEKIITQTPAPPTKIIVPTVVKTHNQSEDSIKVQYYNISKNASTTNQINLVVNVLNTGNTTIDLTDVTLRYYYTVDGYKNQTFYCWAESDKTNITHRFVKMNNPSEKADCYLEMGFKSGQIAPGRSTEIVVWFNKDDWSIYNLENDYSYNSSSIEKLYDWNYIPCYVSGELRFGVEP